MISRTSSPRLLHRQQLLLSRSALALPQQLPEGLRQAPPAPQLRAARGHAAVVLGGPAEVLHEERHVLPEKTTGGTMVVEPC